MKRSGFRLKFLGFFVLSGLLYGLTFINGSGKSSSDVEYTISDMEKSFEENYLVANNSNLPTNTQVQKNATPRTDAPDEDESAIEEEPGELESEFQLRGEIRGELEGPEEEPEVYDEREDPYYGARDRLEDHKILRDEQMDRLTPRRREIIDEEINVNGDVGIPEYDRPYGDDAFPEEPYPDEQLEGEPFENEEEIYENPEEELGQTGETGMPGQIGTAEEGALFSDALLQQIDDIDYKFERLELRYGELPPAQKKSLENQFSQLAEQHDLIMEYVESIEGTGDEFELENLEAAMNEFEMELEDFRERIDYN